jgi:hypothetical protein
MLTGSSAGERFKSVAGWNPQVFETCNRAQQEQLYSRPTRHIWRRTFRRDACRQGLGALVPKTPDHILNVL